MFLNFTKITSARISQVLVRSESIMLLETDSIVLNGVSYPNVTRVEIAGFTRMGFYTSSTFDQIASVINVLDVTTAFDPSVCLSNLVFTTPSYPLVKTQMIFNNTLNELEPYAFNPSFLVSAEEIQFMDAQNKTQETGLMIVLHDADPRKVLTKLTFSDLTSILGAVSVPHN